jgi:hypothetical protein
VTAPELCPVVAVIHFDLSVPDGWNQARYARSCWGILWTDVAWLDPDHVCLVFRSAGERWHAWEEVRLAWILGDRAHDHQEAA